MKRRPPRRRARPAAPSRSDPEMSAPVRETALRLSVAGPWFQSPRVAGKRIGRAARRPSPGPARDRTRSRRSGAAERGPVRFGWHHRRRNGRACRGGRRSGRHQRRRDGSGGRWSGDTADRRRARPDQRVEQVEDRPGARLRRGGDGRLGGHACGLGGGGLVLNNSGRVLGTRLGAGEQQCKAERGDREPHGSPRNPELQLPAIILTLSSATHRLEDRRHAAFCQ